MSAAPGECEALSADPGVPAARGDTRPAPSSGLTHGDLANLSGATPAAVPAHRVHVMARFPSSAEAAYREGVVRIVNGSRNPASVRIQPHDAAGWRYAPLTLTLCGEVANLGTWWSSAMLPRV